MIETLLGGLLGGAFRLAPEILKWMDRNGERSHELAMQDKALEFEKLRGAQRMGEMVLLRMLRGIPGRSMPCVRRLQRRGSVPACAGPMRCRSACGL